MPNENSIRDAAPWHALSVDAALGRLGIDPRQGLSLDEVAQRRERYGENRLSGDSGTRPLFMFLRQFTNLLILVLLAAAIVAGVIGEPVDAIAIPRHRGTEWHLRLRSGVSR